MILDKSVHDELRQKYSPDGSKLRDFQVRIQRILDVVDEICVRNGIDYWLSSGTLLGAVRHGGFIPWDDDLDIEMLQSDVPRFVEACRRELPDGYAVQTHETDRDYFLPLVKVREVEGEEVVEVARFKDGKVFPVKYGYMGIFIDIIPIEQGDLRLVKFSGKPRSLLTKAIYYWKLPKFMLEVIWHMNQFIYSICRFISRFTSDRQHCYVTFGSWFLHLRSLDDIFPLGRIRFEGKMYNAPHDTHAYLTKIYGDYTKLPDESGRRPSHDTNLTW